METVERDFAPLGVKFIYIYKALAHPEWDGYVTPYSLEERLSHIDEAKRTLQSRFTWLCDAMDNRAKHAFGDRPNSEFVINADGVITASRSWCVPDQLREDLIALVGTPTTHTTVEDLDFVYAAPPAHAPSGVVPRLEKPSPQMVGLVIAPEWSKDDQPWFAKLRAEATFQLLQSGTGKLYLGFRMDPIHGVHWNNIDGDSIRVRLEAPDGATLSETFLEFPEVTVPADIDPREFIVDVENWPSDEPLTLTVSYFACHEQEGWCLPIEQRYTIQRERDRNHFWVFSEEENKAFNDQLGRTDNKAMTTDGVDVESRLPGTPPPEMVEQMNKPRSGGSGGSGG